MSLTFAAASLGVSDITRLLLALAMLLGLARLLGEIVRGLGQPMVLGEIAAGIVLGPTLLGAVGPDVYQWLFPGSGEQAAGATQIATDGFITLSATLLLLAVGLEVDLSAVWRQGKAMLSVSAFGIAIPLLAGVTLALSMGEDLGMGERGLQAPEAFTVFVGVALSITALPVIAKILMDLNLAKSDLGMLIISSAMLNDVVGWIGFAVVLALLPALPGEAATGHGVWTTIGLTLGFLALMMTVGRWLMHRVLVYVQAHWSWPGGVIAFVFFVALVSAAFTEWLGVHSIFGAFIAGVALGDSHHLRERTRDTIHQFVTNIFAPVFFASIGLRINFVESFDLQLVALVFVVAATGKVLSCYAGARLAKMSNQESWAVGFGMAAQGAVGIILGQLAFEAKLISESLLVAIVFLALGTSLISGPAMQRVLKRPPRRKFHEILGDRGVLIDPPAPTLEDLLRTMSHHAAEVAGLPPEQVFDAVWRRESMMHTGLPNGLAVPHARLDGLSKSVLVLARCGDGVDFDAPDGQSARLVCLILTPDSDPGAQIEMLSLFAEAFAEADTRRRCLRARNATELRAVLNLAATTHDDNIVPHDDVTLGEKS
ncbi:MAG: cation:proton antiporter [Planctomycetota bacterium]